MSCDFKDDWELTSLKRREGSLLGREDSTFKGPAVGREGVCCWLEEAERAGE